MKDKKNRDRLFQMLDYIKEKEREVLPLELIAFFIPSMYELNLVYNKTFKGKYFNITISMSDVNLKATIRKAHELKHEQDFTSEMILNYLKES